MHLDGLYLRMYDNSSKAMPLSENKYDEHLIGEIEMQENRSDEGTLPVSDKERQEMRIQLNASDNRKNSCCHSIWCCCRGEDPTREKTVYLDGRCEPKNKVSNSVNNQKYNIINFLPLVLFHQFKLFFNFFQLAINLSQLVPALRVGFLFTYLSPLILVMTLTLGKEAYDDFKRYRRDTEANSALYVVRRKGERKERKAKEIKVGDVIEVQAKQRIPADIVILTTSEPTGSIFIKTDQLDGETDWKVRRAIRLTHSAMTGKGELPSACIHHTPACDDIYEFVGSYVQGDHRQSLCLDNTAWANTVLAAGHLTAIVIFVGRETRAQMNSRQPTTKMGKFDTEVNRLSKALFGLMLVLALVMCAFRQINYLWPLYYFRYVLLLASIIPISLRVNLDFCKTYFSYKISSDKVIEGTVCRNSSIPQELGRIDYLLSDKTGTLTYNEMVFKKLSVNEIAYSLDDLDEMKKGVARACTKFVGPLGDMHDEQWLSRKQKRRQECLLRDLATALALCHNVTPVVDAGLRVLQASSPDEIALVSFAEQLGFVLESRDVHQLLLLDPTGRRENYDLLANFPFSSDTKRMGIVIRHTLTNRLMFYLKGADMVMVPLCKAIYRGYIQDECDSLAREGLRTLVISQRELSEEEYAQWKMEYEEASNLLKDRHAAMHAVMEKLERQMDLVGITGVEDKLQDEVAITIEALRMGGIKIWMLTGDKVETAKCIAISAGLKGVGQQIWEVRGEDQLILRKRLTQYDPLEQVLLVDGPALTNILNNNNSSLFFEVARKAPAVICCRCLPTQKALITEKLIQVTGAIVAGIGDGGNDVGMIQLASIGLGIVGKEGNHAALASDVSMLQFKHSKQLLLWHGRNAYKRAAALSQFVIHRGLIISILQMAFSIIFYDVAIPFYNGMLMLGYTTLYTSLPVFALMLDEDLSREKTLLYPNLYVSLRKSREMNTKTFFVWVWISVYQGVVIMVMSLMLFEQSFVRVVTITFSALILSEVLNVATTIHTFTRYILAAQLITVFLYGISLLLLRNYLDTAAIDLPFLWKVLVIVSISWLPVYLTRALRRCISPSEQDKITH